MDTWGTGIFDNHLANDFAADVAGGAGVEALEWIFDRIIETGEDYLEIPEAQEGLAAADIVARMKGCQRPKSTATETIDLWVAQSRGAVTKELIRKARDAVARILSKPSELRDVWEEDDELEPWQTIGEELAAQLGKND